MIFVFFGLEAPPNMLLSAISGSLSPKMIDDDRFDSAFSAATAGAKSQRFSHFNSRYAAMAAIAVASVGGVEATAVSEGSRSMQRILSTSSSSGRVQRIIIRVRCIPQEDFKIPFAVRDQRRDREPKRKRNETTTVPPVPPVPSVAFCHLLCWGRPRSTAASTQCLLLTFSPIGPIVIANH